MSAGQPAIRFPSRDAVVALPVFRHVNGWSATAPMLEAGEVFMALAAGGLVEHEGADRFGR